MVTKRKTSKGSQAQQKTSAKEGRSGSQTSSSSASRKNSSSKPVKKKRLIWPKVVIAVVVLLMVAVVALVSAYRWFLFDDAHDMQDQWIDINRKVEVVIDAETIQLSDDVAYNYELDTFEKTITYTFGNMESQPAAYRFSADRSKLYILEGEESDLFYDIGFWLGFVEEPDYQDSTHATVLMRVADFSEYERLKKEQEDFAKAQKEAQDQLDAERKADQNNDQNNNQNGDSPSDNQPDDNDSGDDDDTDTPNTPPAKDPFGDQLSDTTGPSS